MPGRLEFDFHPSPAARRRTAGPLRLLLLGDFSGRTAAERPMLAERPTHQVDIDRFDAVQLAERLGARRHPARYSSIP